MTNQTSAWIYACRCCGSRFDLSDLPENGTCPWCGGRHLTAYEPATLIGEGVER